MCKNINLVVQKRSLGYCFLSSTLPTSKKSVVLSPNLCFANGIALWTGSFSPNDALVLQKLFRFFFTACLVEQRNETEHLLKLRHIVTMELDTAQQATQSDNWRFIGHTISLSISKIGHEDN